MFFGGESVEERFVGLGTPRSLVRGRTWVIIAVLLVETAQQFRHRAYVVAAFLQARGEEYRKVVAGNLSIASVRRL